MRNPTQLHCIQTYSTTRVYSKTTFFRKTSDVKYLLRDIQSYCILILGNFPKRLQSLFDYKYDIPNKQWTPWSAYVECYRHDSSQKTFDMLVPNEELSKSLWVLDLLCKVGLIYTSYQNFTNMLHFSALRKWLSRHDLRTVTGQDSGQ